MFKPSRIPRTFTRLSRIVPLHARSQAVRYEHSLNVQRVRFTRPPFTWKRATSVFLYTGAFLAYLHFAIPDVEIEDEPEESRAKKGREVTDEDEEDDDYEDEDEEYDEDSLFIPLTWARQKPRTFYKGSDPEWQEFRRFAQDPKRHRAAQEMLVTTVRMSMANQPRISKRFGQINVKSGKYWLDMTFPDGPPQEYERSGIEITDDFIGWTTRPVSQMNYGRLNRVLWPTAAFSSFYATSRYMFLLRLNQTKQLLGLAPKEDEKIVQLRAALEAVHPGAQTMLPKPAPPGTSGRSAADPAKGIAPIALPAPPQGQRAPEAGGKEKAASLPSLPTIQRQPIAMSVFANTWVKNWTPLNVEAPRGSIVVSGLIEVQGSKARATMDVVAAYDPKQNKYVAMSLGVRRVQDKKQAPKGGH
ncbi:hypothetical protein H2201_000927 [Coniosporium apollinis]|uniref:Uncharacterized protein n=2 Tax=Coniosporium TaxID=2810619 RepID=A0ABQ9P539_9PEZI|nr:hypothetical protein H2199_001451 [Cladosporium sp. JES 115]KAJ9669101.1 hypothetical protein H2201_000927 [Coniosporium apollinis]